MACNFVRTNTCNCWRKFRRYTEADKQSAIRKGIKVIEQARIRREISTWEANQIVSALERGVVTAETSNE